MGFTVQDARFGVKDLAHGASRKSMSAFLGLWMGQDFFLTESPWGKWLETSLNGTLNFIKRYIGSS